MKRRRFSGRTYNAARDHDRLSAQYDHVFALMRDGEWHTLAGLRWDIDARFGVEHPEASISARLRDMRKERFGSHIVERDYLGMGTWRYRIVVPRPRRRPRQ